MRRALSLIEVVVSLAVLSIVMLGFMAATSATSVQRTLADEDHLAEQFLMDAAASLQSIGMDDLLQGNWARPAIDDLVDSTVDVVFVTDEVGANTTAAGWLYRDVATVAATTVSGDDMTKLKLVGGMDLNGDRDVADGNLPVTTTAEREAFLLVPCKLTLQWRSVVDPTTLRSMDVYVLLSDF